MSAAHVVPKDEEPAITPFPARSEITCFSCPCFYSRINTHRRPPAIPAPPIVDGTEQNLSPGHQCDRIQAQSVLPFLWISPKTLSHRGRSLFIA
jgi:hypothetical protein